MSVVHPKGFEPTDRQAFFLFSLPVLTMRGYGALRVGKGY